MIEAIARFVGFSLAEKRLIVEAGLHLLVVRLILGLLPFPWALKVLAVAPGAPATHGRVVASEAEAVGRAVARAARHVPFRAVCLQQAFAALLMLRRRGLAAIVHLGVAHEASGAHLKAHAWSYSGDVPVTGVPASKPFAAVVAFAA